MKDLGFSLRSHRRLALIIGLVILALPIIAFTAYKYINQPVALTALDQQDIKNVALTAYGAVDELIVIPHANSNLAVKLTEAEIAEAHAHAQTTFKTIYAPDCKICQNIENSIDKTIDGQIDGHYRALDGGVRNVSWRPIVSLSDGTVKITLAATAWSKLTLGGQIVTPQESMVTTYTLKKFGNQWLILDESQQGGAA